MRWQSIKSNGDPGIEEFHTTKNVKITSGETFVTVTTVTGNELVLQVPSWRILDITTD
jgi:hypothetical protein